MTTKLSPTACSGCRAQKLRCSREQPICVRCARRGLPCTFPKLQDRVRLSKNRTILKRHGSNPTIDQPDLYLNSLILASGPSHEPPLYCGEYSPTILPILQYEESSAFQCMLLDVYFEYCSNANLIFHRRSFLEAWEQNSAPQHVLLAVYASAAKYNIPSILYRKLLLTSDTSSYLTPHARITQRFAAQLSKVGDLRIIGRQWALKAGAQALLQADQTTLPCIQTCLILALYWFGAGDAQRNTMFSGIAYRAIRSLAVHDGTWASASNFAIPKSASFAKMVKVEVLRRCFWASWISNSFNSDHCEGAMCNDRVTLAMPLPISDVSFEHGVTAPSISLQAFDDPCVENVLAISASKASLMAQLVGAVWSWKSVRELIESQVQMSAAKYRDRVAALDQRLESWAAGLSPAFVYSKVVLQAQLLLPTGASYCLMHAVYYQSRLILRFSLIDSIAESFALKESSATFEINVRIVRTFVCSIFNLAKDMLALNYDSSKLAPFVGYCMYSAAAINIALSQNSHDEGAQEGRKASIEILRSMKSHWAILEGLWSRIMDSPGSSARDGSFAYVRMDNLAELLGNFVMKYSLRQVSDHRIPEMNAIPA